MRWRYVLFDLDGTLFDTSPGIMRCLYESLAECGFDGGDLRRFVGPPLLESLSEFCGMDAAHAVATSKPLRFALQILTRFRFDRYFDVVCGAESDAHSAKAEIVAEALARLGSPAPADCVMVGDRKYDVLGAAANGIPCIALDSGFAAEGEYEKAGALCVCKDFSAVLRALTD